MPDEPRVEGSLIGRISAAWPCGLLFVIPGVFAVYLKSIILAHSGGYLAISRFLGRSGQGGDLAAADFTILERLSLFREDIFISLVVIPVAGTILVSLLGPRARPWAAAALSSVLTVLIFVSLLAFANVGSFLSVAMASDAILWGIDHPEDFSSYASGSSITKLCLLIGACLAGAWMLKSPRIQPLAGRLMALGFTSALLLGSGFAAAGMLVTLNVSSGYTSATQRVLSAVVEVPADAGEFKDHSAAELSLAYRELSRTPAPPTTDPLSGIARGRDVILVILETATTAGLDLGAEVAAGGSLDALRGSVLISDMHFSTYPYTSDAHFSILTSMYPLGRHQALKARDQLRTIGWPSVLKKNGYSTHLYSPGPSIDSFESDVAMYRIVGFEHSYIGLETDTETWRAALLRADTTLGKFYDHAGNRDQGLVKRTQYDLAAFERLTADALDMKARNQRFLATFRPQLGHAPWYDLVGTDSTLKRGAALVKMQMAWLGDLANELERRGQLESTLIVVTADHGLRTRTEFANLAQGAITGVSVNVPLLVYASGAFAGVRQLTHPTSHVDIGPTVLALLGIEDTRQTVHGHPVWAEDLSERIAFFFGAGYLGADGFVEAGTHVSCETFNGTCSSWPVSHGASQQMTLMSPGTRDRAAGLLRQLTAMQVRAIELAIQ